MTAATMGRNGRPLAAACPSGHPYTEDNVGYRANGVRFCRTCNRAGSAARRAAASTGEQQRFVDGDGLIDILAAVVRQALHDHATGYDDRPHMPAAAFLSSCGLLRADGSMDYHGHKIPARGVRRQS